MILDNDGIDRKQDLWYEKLSAVAKAASLSGDAVDQRKVGAAPRNLADVEQQAAYAFEKETKVKKHATEKGESKLLSSIARAGTVDDKLSALIVLVQESPVRHLNDLQTLVGSFCKDSRKHQVTAVANIAELFCQYLLPDRTLVPLGHRPIAKLPSNKSASRSILCFWYFEDVLKKVYKDFVTALVSLTQDTIETHRRGSIRVVARLLTSRPELEEVLLSTLVNKLGDSSNRIVTGTVIPSLLSLTQTHPNMRLVIVREIERLLYRPNVGQRAQYQALCVLSRIMLIRSDAELADKLLEIYLAIFKILVSTNELSNRQLGIVLKGINKAFPYTSPNNRHLADEIDTLYKAVALADFNVRLQALTLLFHVHDKSIGILDRFYCALYRTIGSPELFGTGRLDLLFNLLFKALRADSSEERCLATVKRVLQVALHHQPTFAAATLIMLSQLAAEKEGILKLVSGPSNKVSSACSEVASTSLAATSDDEEEHYEDVSDGEDSPTAAQPATERKDKQQSTPSPVVEGKSKKGSSWTHRVNLPTVRHQHYDPLGRNPQFAAAEMTVTHELSLLARHYHPTVALWASNLLQGQDIEYSGDPLTDFTTMKFLDRFVYKKPKTEGEKQRAKLMFGRRKTFNPWAASSGVPVTSDTFLCKSADQVPAHERYLHRYLTSVAKPTSKDDESDIESIGSEGFDRIVDKIDPLAEKEEFVLDDSDAVDQEDGGSEPSEEEEEEEDSEMELNLMGVGRAGSDSDSGEEEVIKTRQERRERGRMGKRKASKRRAMSKGHGGGGKKVKRRRKK